MTKWVFVLELTFASLPNYSLGFCHQDSRISQRNRGTSNYIIWIGLCTRSLYSTKKLQICFGDERRDKVWYVHNYIVVTLRSLHMFFSFEQGSMRTFDTEFHWNSHIIYRMYDTNVRCVIFSRVLLVNYCKFCILIGWAIAHYHPSVEFY